MSDQLPMELEIHIYFYFLISKTMKIENIFVCFYLNFVCFHYMHRSLCRLLWQLHFTFTRYMDCFRDVGSLEISRLYCLDGLLVECARCSIFWDSCKYCSPRFFFRCLFRNCFSWIFQSKVLLVYKMCLAILNLPF